MGNCSCSCKCRDESLSFDEVLLDVDFLVDQVYSSVYRAYEIGMREGAKITTDLVELEHESNENRVKVEDLVEADAIALDAALVKLQDIIMRLEAIEMTLGLKYME